jgi:uncharacterized protein (TIGR02444 family)
VDAAHDATNQSNNPLWIYSVKQYSNDSCSLFLLNAQHLYQLDINVLLFIGWLATKNKLLNMPALTKAHIFEWQYRVITPIRNLRKRLKPLGNHDFYQHMKDLELSAEYQEQLTLYKLHELMDKSNWGFNRLIQESCEVYFKELKQEIDESWLQTLIEHLQPR